MSSNLNLEGRSLLTLGDLTDGELLQLLELSEQLKANKAAGIPGESLRGKNIALIFEKMSTRTRCAFAVAAADEGGVTEYLGSNETHLGKKESVADTARVLGRMFDGIMFRGYKHETVETLARFSGVPVWNGLTDKSHPTQTLADLLTLKEQFGHLRGLKVVYVGDGRNNVVNSLMIGCAKTGIHFVNCTPSELAPLPELVKWSRNRAELNGGSVSIVNAPDEGLEDANAVYTDVWVSMGEESEKEERIELLKPFQVDMEMMNRTGKMESGEVIFLHCLPAFHDDQTEVTKGIGALEVTNDVFEAQFSRVFDQAENRMHTIKAMMVSSL